MISPLRQRLACLLFLLGASLSCPTLLPASQNRESGTSTAKPSPSQQQAEESEYLGAARQTSVPDVSLTAMSSDGESQFSLAKTLGSILLILALILVLAFFLKRYMPHRFASGGKRRFIHILENVSLGERRSLTLIRIDQEHLLLASTSTSISLIKEINLCPAVESPQGEHPISRSRMHASEPTESGEGLEPAIGGQVNSTFRNLMVSELNDSEATGRKGIHPVLSKLSQIRKELQTRLGNS